MKKVLFFSVFCFLWGSAGQSRSQGILSLNNITAPPNRVGSFDGPLAGTNEWAQFLAGTTTDSLSPVGPSLPHLVSRNFEPRGLVVDGVHFFEDLPPGARVFVQLVAWSEPLWGKKFSEVPNDWLGRTDVVPVTLGHPMVGAIPRPLFSQPAIIPIPEPSSLAFFVLGVIALLPNVFLCCPTKSSIK